MSFSVRSSRKRTRDVSWEDVMHSKYLRELTVDKDELVKHLQEIIDAFSFLNQTQKLQAEIWIAICG